MRKITADTVFPVSAAPVPEGVIITDDQGLVLEITSRAGHDPASLETYRGAIIPGFVNTHCHLELSHMKGLVPTGTTLLPFLYSVVAYRDFPMEVILDAIDQAGRDMYEAGIMAVGDISNKLDTARHKDNSPILYYTFVEMFDFLQNDLAESTFARYFEVFKGQSDRKGNRKSCVPHAPYTVSPELFRRINQANAPGQTVSIHNQETPLENELFRSKSGGFLDFYQRFGFPLDHFVPTQKSSIHYALEHMRPDTRVLFVHNTTTQPEDIRAAQDWNAQVFWATCPNANLYIENALPYYQHFLDTGAVVTIGTDSLTSNWQLSILEEMKTIARYQSYVPFETLLQWATLNGARALGFDDSLGSIEPGKKPGLLLLNLEADLKLTPDSMVRRLV